MIVPTGEINVVKNRVNISPIKPPPLKYKYDWLYALLR